MYLSCLMINIGNNPDHEDWRNRGWLANRYRVHQRLSMAFPSQKPVPGCASFLKPFDPNDFPSQASADAILNGTADINDAAASGPKFLFRIDLGPFRPQGQTLVPDDPCGAQNPSRPMILVQSEAPPNWDYAFGLDPEARDPRTGRPIGNAAHLLAARPQVNDQYLIENHFEQGQRFRFRLTANPTRRMANGPFKGKRVGVGGRQAIVEWLWRKGAGLKTPDDQAEHGGGFDIEFRPGDEGWDSRWRIETGVIRAWKSPQGEQDRNPMVFACANIDGILKVTEPDRFLQTLQQGIGPAKAFGFALLSIAPLGNDDDDCDRPAK